MGKYQATVVAMLSLIVCASSAYSEESKGKVFTNADLQKYTYPSDKKPRHGAQRLRENQGNGMEFKMKPVTEQGNPGAMDRIHELEKRKADLQKQMMDIDREMQDVRKSKALTSFMKESSLGRLKEQRDTLRKKEIDTDVELDKACREAGLSGRRVIQGTEDPGNDARYNSEVQNKGVYLGTPKGRMMVDTGDRLKKSLYNGRISSGNIRYK